MSKNKSNHARRIASSKARQERRATASEPITKSPTDKMAQEEKGRANRDSRQRFSDFVEEVRCGYNSEDEDANLATREEMEIEAIKRLEFLTKAGLLTHVLKHFSYKGDDPYYTRYRLYYSDNVALNYPILYWVDQDTSLINGSWHIRSAVDEFEREYNALVYHVVLIRTRDLGDIAYLFYVSQHKCEWYTDRYLLTEGRAFVGCPDGYGSWEFGTTWYRVIAGGLAYSDHQVIPRTDYDINHAYEGCEDDDGGRVIDWWNAA